MKSVHTLALAATAGLALASPAMAQERDKSQDYNGVYVGGSVGYAFDNNSGPQTLVFDTDRNGTFDNTVTTTTGANAFSPGFCTGKASGVTPETACTGKDDGIDYSVRIGVDKRMGNMVIGGLIEGGKSKAKESVTAFSTTPASYTITRDLDWNVAARARLGFTPGGGGLFYVTGGASYARINHDFATSNTANSFTPSDDKMTWGWQAGGGAEVMLGKSVSLGVEYLYSRYNDNKYVVAVGPGTAPATNPFLLNGGGTNLRMADTRFDNHSIRATVGFHF